MTAAAPPAPIEAFEPPNRVEPLAHPWRELRWFDSLESTQQRARAEAAAGGDIAGCVFRAGCQTGGHGRDGRGWDSATGGIYVTAALPAAGAIAPRELGWLPLMAALAAAEEIEQRYGLRPALKWPNDLLLDGGKLAGVLGDVVAGPGAPMLLVGMGLNWLNPLPVETSLPATRLADAVAGLTAEAATDFLHGWLDRLAARHHALAAHASVATEALAAAATARLWRLGEPLRLERTEIGPVEGTLVGLGPGGSALMRLGEGAPLAIHCGRPALERQP